MLKNTFIGFDRDGTLELADHPIPERLIQKFQILKEQGATLFIASGKSYADLQVICNRISLNPWLYCAENGGHIVIPDQVEWLDESSQDILFFKDNISNIALPPAKLEDKRLLWSRTFGANAAEAADILNEFVAQHKLNLDVLYYRSGGGTVEIVPKGVNKTNLLKYLPEAKTIHFVGDNINDLNLMNDPRVTPHAVGNAIASVKECVAKKGGIVSDFDVGRGVLDILDKLYP
jgi:HAD superfamily hydrolase (TIGR01484 family)